MAKADISEKVRPEFKGICELLHQGFADEKLVVPASLLRSDHFVLIDEYKDIKDSFMLGAAMSAEGNMGSTNGYRIFKKNP